jgi:hypothetical protein
VKARTEGANPTLKRDEYGFTLAKVPQGQNLVGLDSFTFPINVQQVFFATESGQPKWKVVCKVDVRSRRSPLQFTADESEVLNGGRDGDFEGLTAEYRNYDVVPGVVPDLETVYMPELSTVGGCPEACPETSCNAEGGDGRSNSREYNDS